MELYSQNRYEGYRLFVEVHNLDENHHFYEGYAQSNGTTIFSSQSLISGDAAEESLKAQIDAIPL